MTMDELRAELEALGWRIDKAHKPTGVSWEAWKRLPDWPDCELNKKPPPLELTPYATEDHPEWSTVEFSVHGEAQGHAFALKFYAVPTQDAIATIPKAEASLGAAWRAVTGKKA